MTKRGAINLPNPLLLARLKMRYRNDVAALKVLEEIFSAWVLEVRIDLLNELAKENGIDLDSNSGPLALALHLAKKHEPGFQVEGFEEPIGKVGRPRGKGLDQLQLILTVLEHMDGKRSAIEAIRQMRKKQPWKQYTEGALKTAYSRARKWPTIDEGDPFIRFATRRIEESQAQNRG